MAVKCLYPGCDVTKDNDKSMKIHVEEDHLNPMYVTMKYSNIKADEVQEIIKPRGWYAIDTLNVTLEILEVIAECRDHRIGIANANFARVCWLIEADTTGEMALVAEDNYPGYGKEKEKFIWKDFLFLPLNDDYEKTDSSEGGTYSASNHWTVLTVDCRNPYKWHARLFDSLYNRA